MIVWQMFLAVLPLVFGCGKVITTSTSNWSEFLYANVLCSDLIWRRPEVTHDQDVGIFFVTANNFSDKEMVEPSAIYFGDEAKLT